jgi:hypothetical protein
MTKIRTYSELKNLETFDERFQYLKLNGSVGNATFGFDRWVNQRFYKSWEWKHARNAVIVRDNGCDLGVSGYEIHAEILIHHVNPVTVDDIYNGESWMIDPEYLITTTKRTHNAIHYGGNLQVPEVVTVRKPGDTKLW